MRHSDSGVGYGKAILTVAMLAAFAYTAIKFVPVYVHNFELQSYINDLAVKATVDRSSSDAIRNVVVAKAQDLDLPVAPADVAVQSGNKVTIKIDYKAPIDLKVYTWVLHFTDSAENRAL